MRNDKIHVRIFLGEQFTHGYRTHDVVYNRQRKCTGDLTNLAVDGSVVAMQLDADEAEFLHSLPNQFVYTPSIMNAMHKGKTKEPIRTTCDDACNLTVGDRIIGMKRGEEDRVGYSRPGGADEIFVEWRGGIPWTGQPVAFARMQ